jgi:hypothetical protein
MGIIERGETKMPRKDGTGPDGKGPKTGRGLGPCTNRSRTTTKTSRRPRRGGVGRRRGRK